MAKRRNSQSSWVRGARVAALTAVTGVVFVSLLGGDVEEAYGLGALFQLRGSDPAPPGIVTVAIDRASAETLQLPFPPPWPRTVHADLIRALKQRGAKAILLDLYFDEERDPESRSNANPVFADAIGEAGNVALLQRMVRGTGVAERDELIDPADTLRNAAVAVAPFPLPNVSERVTRFWTFRNGRPTLASVALQLATLDLADEWAAILKREGFSLQDRSRPIVEAMSDLRRQFVARPDAGDRLRQAIALLEPVKTRRLAALLDMYVGDDTRVLNFLGPPGTIATIPYASVINGQSSATDVKGKIVVVGFDEHEFVSNVDSYKTVYSGPHGVDLSGVEILATAISNLTSESTLKSSGTINLLILISIGLVIGGIAATSPPTGVIAAAAGACLVAVIAGGYFAFTEANLVIPIITPAAEVMFGLVMTAALIGSAERKLRLSLEHVIRQWLPGEVVDSVLQRTSVPNLPSGETHFAICLATDIQGFTAIAEKLPLASLNDLMRDYFEPFFAAVRRNDGIISNIAGDGTLCTWKTDPGAPEARGKAIRAALDISAGVEKFNEGHPNSKLPTRIGLHAGEVVFTVVGGSGRYVAALLGDAANAVSRIEFLNRKLRTCVLASEEALAGVAGFITRPLGAFLFEGRSQPISVVEILGSSGADPPKPLPVEGFAAGIAAFDTEQWSEAIRCFEKLHREYPDDGPVSYFLGLAELYSANPPPSGSSRPIHVNVK